MIARKILVVDDSTAIQDMCRRALEAAGYRVFTAGNGVAALVHPDLEKIDLVIIDSHLHEESGFDTSRQIKTDPELYAKPVLLMIPENETLTSESTETFGADAWIKKPFDPQHLVDKVNAVMEDLKIRARAGEHLKRAADDTMRRLAESHIQQAVDQKTQIMIERALQMVISQVDLRTRHEVDTRVNHLVSEKEQELVKATVQEVARSTVGKVAEKRVADAIDRILREEAEKAVRKSADTAMPGLVHERVTHGIDQLLPKEVARRVQKEAEDIVPTVSQKLVEIINTAAQKQIPRIASEIVAEKVDGKISDAIDNKLPRQVKLLVAQEVDSIMRTRMEGYIRDAARDIRRRITLIFGLLLVLLCLVIFVFLADVLFGPIIPRPGGPGRPGAGWARPPLPPAQLN